MQDGTIIDRSIDNVYLLIIKQDLKNIKNV